MGVTEVDLHASRDGELQVPSEFTTYPNGFGLVGCVDQSLADLQNGNLGGKDVQELLGDLLVRATIEVEQGHVHEFSPRPRASPPAQPATPRQVVH
jgi:hypothetical protein